MNKMMLMYMLNVKREYAMKIKAITIEGFRNIDSATVKLEDLTALVSLNGFGKSNLLQAISFGVDFLTYPETAKKNMMAWTEGVPLNKATASKDFMINFELELQGGKIIYLLEYGFKFKWVNDNDSGSKIIGEWLRVKREHKSQKFNTYISRDAKGAFYRASETGRCSKKLLVDDNQLAINKLKAFDSLYYSSIVKAVNSLSVYIERHLDASSSYEPDPIIRKDFDALNLENIENVPRTIFSLQKMYPNKYELLINAFKQLFPQIKDIKVNQISIKSEIQTNIPENVPLKVSDCVYALYVFDDHLNQPISFERLSDGAKRVFLMLTYALIADIEGISLIAIEEPENSIHPSLLQAYLRTLSQLLDNCSVLITSHSPYVLKFLKPSNIYVGIPSNDGIARFFRIDENKTKKLLRDADSIDIPIGDYIFDLLSGTKEDISQLSEYLEK